MNELNAEKPKTFGSVMEYAVQHIAREMELNYIFDRWQTANIQLDKAAFPVVVNVLPLNGNLLLQNGRWKDRQQCLIAFLDKTRLDFDGFQNSFIVEKMKNLAIEFITRLEKEGLVKVDESSVRYDVCYDKLDTATTGVIVYLDITTPPVCKPGVCSNYSTFDHTFDETFQSICLKVPCEAYSVYDYTYDKTFKKNCP